MIVQFWKKNKHHQRAHPRFVRPTSCFQFFFHHFLLKASNRSQNSKLCPYLLRSNFTSPSGGYMSANNYSSHSFDLCGQRRLQKGCYTICHVPAWRWLGLSPHSKKVPGSNLGFEVCMFCLCTRGFSPGTLLSPTAQRHAC